MGKIIPRFFLFLFLFLYKFFFFKITLNDNWYVFYLFPITMNGPFISKRPYYDPHPIIYIYFLYFFVNKYYYYFFYFIIISINSYDKIYTWSTINPYNYRIFRWYLIEFCSCLWYELIKCISYPSILAYAYIPALYLKI